MKSLLPRRAPRASFNFFARNEGTFVALALLGGLAVLPFAINNLVQERWGLGIANGAIAAWFLVHGVAVYRGTRLLPPWVVFGPAIPMLAYIMWMRGEVGIFWAYPAALLFHFILQRRAANLFNASVVLITTFFAWQSYDADVALRVFVTLVLTIVFANVFSYVSEAQRKREAQQEQQLELERDRLMLLVHATQAGFTDWDTKANVVIYSERFKEMLGYPSEHDTSSWASFFDLMHPEDHPRVREVFRGLMREKRKPGLQPPGEPLEYRLLKNGGGHVWVKAASLAQVDAAGQIRRFITSFQDVSAYRATADALRDQLKFSADIFDALPIGLAMRDLQGRYMFVNRTWEKYTGAKREDVIGKTVRERAPKEEAERVEAEDREALARGVGAPPELKDLHYAGKYYVLTRTVIADANGAPRGVVVASLDTTERHVAEERLAGEQRRAALLMQAANVGILDWDGLNRTVYYSPRFKEILRYPANADTSKWPDYWEMVHADDRERASTAFRNHIRGAGAGDDPDVHEPIQYRLRRADGTYVWVEAFGASVRDARGFATRFIASINDISERRFQEEAMRAAARLREEVERMSRHDLKTPINSVIAMSRLMRESGNLRREDDELLGSIERAGYRVLNMVNLSLDLFRMEQGSYEFRPRPVDLAEVARRVAADLESQAASKGVRVRVQSAGASVAHAEELLCYSMLANLIKNAIEASPDDAEVTVRLEALGDTLLTRVHNAGAVPEAVRERFFQKYATAGKSGGIGLGAYSARLLARVQQGDLSLQTSEAEGTTVTIKLALAAVEQPVLAPAKQDKDPAFVPPAPAGRTRRILVVDDDEFNRMVLRRFLPSPPFEVEVAVNGRAALDAARKAWPDAVLLDLEMPVMDGYQAAAKLREMEREGGLKRCTIVAISSNDEDAIIRRALAAGCDHYQVKPAPRETLLRLLAGEAVAPRAAPEPAEAGPGDAVELDPDLEAALPAFLASRAKALDEMPQALDANDRARFKRLAHRLAGSFTLYGFRWAAAQCKALERNAPAAATAELRKGAAEVRAHLDVVKVRVKARAGEGK